MRASYSNLALHFISGVTAKVVYYREMSSGELVPTLELAAGEDAAYAVSSFKDELSVNAR